MLLGLGSTLGIVAQFLILVPYLRAAGFRYSPRFDFRDAGLGHTLRLGLWTVLFVVVNQLAYLVVVKLASSGTAAGGDGTGYTVYQNTFLIMMVPHSIVTVSLATAILPRLSDQAAERRLADMGRTLSSTLRTSLAVILPFAALLPVLAPDLATVLFGFGAGASTVDNFVPSLALFGPGLVFFTVHYLMLRGFYALEQTRRVFFVQCAIAATNIAVAVLLVGRADPEQTSPALVLAYLSAYVVGSATSYLVLRRTLHGLETARLVRFLVRMVIVVGVTAAVAVGLAALLGTWAVGTAAKPVALARALGVASAAGAVYLGLARLLRVTEVTEVLDTVVGRLRRR